MSLFATVRRCLSQCQTFTDSAKKPHDAKPNVRAGRPHRRAVGLHSDQELPWPKVTDPSEEHHNM